MSICLSVYANACGMSKTSNISADWLANEDDDDDDDDNNKDDNNKDNQKYNNTDKHKDILLEFVLYPQEDERSLVCLIFSFSYCLNQFLSN